MHATHLENDGPDPGRTFASYVFTRPFVRLIIGPVAAVVGVMCMVSVRSVTWHVRFLLSHRLDVVTPRV